MDSEDQLLSFMDLLDLNEELVDSRLKSIMNRNTFTSKHLANAMNLLKYKNLINLQEGTDCDNDEECMFIAKLLNIIHNGNISIICEIVNIILGLNKSKIVSKSEHFLQQIFCVMDLPLQRSDNMADCDNDEEISHKLLLNFKICDSILDAVIKTGEKLSIPFLETPLVNVVSSQNDKLKVYFLNNIVPKLFEGISECNILDKIWNYLKSKDDKNNAIKVLCTLSEFYVPVPDNEGNMKFASNVVLECEFWSILLNGLKSSDLATRKMSIYLIKRAIDSIESLNKDVTVTTEMETIFIWLHKDKTNLKENWNNYFILIDSLEEKQSNIVLPSLQLLKNVNEIPKCWLHCALNIGLKHDNTQVRIKCIEYRLRMELESLSDAIILLEALNDINLYDNEMDCGNIKTEISKAMEDPNNLLLMIKAICYIKWNPVPLYHVSDILAWQTLDLTTHVTAAEFSKIVIDILKVPCNIKLIRHAVKINLTYFIGICFQALKWKDLINVFSFLKLHKFPNEHSIENPLVNNIKRMNVHSNEKEEFFKAIAASHANVDLGLIYLETYESDLELFKNFVNEKLKKIEDVTVRQYSNKAECLSDVHFILYLFSKIQNNEVFAKNIAPIIYQEYKTISSYLYGLLQSTDITLTVEEIGMLFEGYKSMHIINDDSDARDYLTNIYHFLTLIIPNQSTGMSQKVFAVNFIATITDVMHNRNQHFSSLKNVLNLFNRVTIKENAGENNVGRYKNAFYEKSCSIIYKYICSNEHALEDSLKEQIDYVENVIECGGYGCLQWVLKIMNIILPEILKNENTNFNVVEFFARMWKEIEELKSNNQYIPCIEQFAELITQDALLNKPIYNNIVVLYCNKIINYGSLKTDPLYFLAKKLNMKILTEDNGHLIYVLSDILTFFSMHKKDQRIAENLAVQILKDPKYAISQLDKESHFDYTIQYTAILILTKLRQEKAYELIACLLIKKIEDHFQNKLRYHGNSQSHKLLLLCIQHLLFLNTLTSQFLKTEENVNWAIEFLGRLPHQPSVRVCLEWYIAHNFSLKNLCLEQKLVEILSRKNVPLTSQFMIIYWTLKYKMLLRLEKQEEYDFVMDYLLSHTMGQIFNIRLLAQYLATELYKEPEVAGVPSGKINKEKYVYILKVIEKTFDESSKDKNFVKLQEDYFIKKFNPVTHLTPSFIYYFVGRYFNVQNNEHGDIPFIKDIVKEMSLVRYDKNNCNDHNQLDDEVFAFDFSKSNNCSLVSEKTDTMGTIQKKYIPWKNMGDIDVYGIGEKKMQSPSELIVVASLIDKLPNLGGMARTSEVFGVKTFIIDSLRHLQDRQFQGLSVSAERWVNIKEVRPGQPLKDYLMRKKREGYCITAAEQTSNSVQLQKFRFPKKTLLLLGHEKEGVPCDLLPLMDHCVEIPQQGFVRSLNVHVTAAIFVWEYSRQHIL